MITVYRAIEKKRMTQDYAENKACVRTDANNRPYRPFRVVTAINGVCPALATLFYKLMGMKGHNGRDWSARIGTPGYFPCDFKGFARYDNDMDGGVGLDIVSYKPKLACTEGCKPGTIHYIKWRAWHLSKRAIQEKAPVFLGSFIFRTGNTGASSGPHLHESLKWCDKDGKGLHSNNGYYGSIDIEKHPDVEFKNYFVLDVLNVPDICEDKLAGMRFILRMFIQEITRLTALIK